MQLVASFVRAHVLILSVVGFAVGYLFGHYRGARRTARDLRDQLKRAGSRFGQ